MSNGSAPGYPCVECGALPAFAITTRGEPLCPTCIAIETESEARRINEERDELQRMRS